MKSKNFGNVNSEVRYNGEEGEGDEIGSSNRRKETNWRGDKEDRRTGQDRAANPKYRGTVKERREDRRHIAKRDNHPLAVLLYSTEPKQVNSRAKI